MNSKLAALATIFHCLVQEKIRGHLEDLVAQRHREGRDVLGDLIAWCQGLAEVVIDYAVKVGHTLLPVLLKEDKGLVWDAQIAAACVDDGWEARVIQNVLLSTIFDAFCFNSPLFDALRPIGPVIQRLHLV